MSFRCSIGTSNTRQAEWAVGGGIILRNTSTHNTFSLNPEEWKMFVQNYSNILYSMEHQNPIQYNFSKELSVTVNNFRSYGFFTCFSRKREGLSEHKFNIRLDELRDLYANFSNVDNGQIEVIDISAAVEGEAESQQDVLVVDDSNVNRVISIGEVGLPVVTTSSTSGTPVASASKNSDGACKEVASTSTASQGPSEGACLDAVCTVHDDDTMNEKKQEEIEKKNINLDVYMLNLKNKPGKMPYSESVYFANERDALHEAIRFSKSERSAYLDSKPDLSSIEISSLSELVNHVGELLFNSAVHAPLCNKDMHVHVEKYQVAFHDTSSDESDEPVIKKRVKESKFCVNLRVFNPIEIMKCVEKVLTSFGQLEQLEKSEVKISAEAYCCFMVNKSCVFIQDVVKQMGTD